MLLGLMDPGSLLNTLGSFEAVKCLSCIFQLQIHSFLQCHLQCNLGGAAHKAMMREENKRHTVE